MRVVKLEVNIVIHSRDKLDKSPSFARVPNNLIVQFNSLLKSMSRP